MQEQPLVSILLLSMNHETYVEQCIQSLQDQTYKNIEIIYLDNSSTDRTYTICRELLEKSGIPFQSFQNTGRKNIPQNLNFLLDHASGKFISPLSTDDWFHKNNIKQKLDFLLLHNDIGAVYSNGWIYNEATKELTLNDSSSFKRGKIYKKLLTNPDCIFYVGVMYSREIIDKAGKWDESLLIEDVDMLIRISLIVSIDYINEPLVYYRRTQSSASKNFDFMLKGFHQYYDKYKGIKWLNMKNWLSERYRSVAANYITNEKKNKAKPYLKKALQLNPTGIKNYRTLWYFIKSSYH